MASKEIATRLSQQVKPFFSTNQQEAKRRVIHLYREWQKALPQIHLVFDIPISINQMRAKVGEHFRNNKAVDDVRTVDALVWKGHMELIETREMWKTRTHVMLLFGDENKKPKSDDFLSKFYEGC